MIAATAALAAVWLLLGCTSTVTPPRHVADPVTVMIIRDAMHRGLLLPEGAGYVEYGFGDWNWYANGADSWYHTFATVLWPTRGTLSRRWHAGVTVTAVRDGTPWATFDELSVERAAAERLRARLAAEFAAASNERVRRPDLRMDFVPHANSYWWADNCADACAVWLEELGCVVSWVPIRTNLAVARGD